MADVNGYFKELSDTEKQQLSSDIEFFATQSPVYWKEVRTQADLASAERLAVEELCEFVKDTNDENPGSLDPKAALILAGARAGQLLDLARQAKIMGLDCPQVPFQAVQYVLSSVYDQSLAQ